MKNLLNLELADFAITVLVRYFRDELFRSVFITSLPDCKNYNLDADCRRTILENGGTQEIVNCLSRYAVLAEIFKT